MLKESQLDSSPHQNIAVFVGDAMLMPKNNKIIISLFTGSWTECLWSMLIKLADS